jgi:tape measure domain-containing protein
MLQFGQALGSGKLAGDELRSLMETAPYLMRQLADGIGVPVGALKKLGEEGKLTADVVVNALTKAAAKIDEDFKKFPQTIEAAMVVAADAAGLAVLKLDALTGSSAALTGVTKGLGEVLDKVADQLGAMNTEAGNLERNAAVRTWADASRTALSYLADAADVVWQTLSVLGRNVAFVFQGIGTEIGGIGAQVKAVMNGDFAGAKAIGDEMKADAARRRAELDAADARTLGRAKLMGQAMREAWQQGAGGGRGFVNPTAAPSKLKPPTPDPGKPKTGEKFDAGAYLAGLEKSTLDGLERVDAIEREALRKNAALLAEKKITAEQAAKAITLIEANAAKDRRDIQLQFAEDMRQAYEESGKDELAARQKLQEQQRAGQALAAGAIAGAQDPVTQLQLELQAKSDALAKAAALDMENLTLYAEARVALEQETAARIAEIRQRQVDLQAQNNMMSLSLMSDLAGQAYSILEKQGREQTALGKALFLAQKAIAVAEILINTEVAAAKAQGQLGVFGIPLATMIRATGYASAGMVAGMAIGEVAGKRQYGGPVSSGNLYRVNETGRPEMFTASNGSQYMMPTASGKVTAADKVGGGTVVQLQVVNQHPTAQVSQRSGPDGQPQLVISEIARQIRENEGPIWAAMRGGTNIRGAL